MTTKLNLFNQQNISTREKLSPGDIVKIQLEIPKNKKNKKIDKKNKSRTQIFKGTVIAVKHGKEIGATFTVRGTVANIAVERIFPLHSPLIKKIEIIKQSKVRRAKLYYLRKVNLKKARLKKRIKKDNLKIKSEKSLLKEKNTKSSSK